MSVATDKDVLLPNELERRQIFHNLKKASSYTGHRRILGFFQTWANIAEASVRAADNNAMLAVLDPTTGDMVGKDKTSLVYSDYVGILKSLTLYDEGVTRLRKGDRRVFTCGVDGVFVQARGLVGYWDEFKNRAKQGDIEWKEETPYGKEFFKALDNVSAGPEYGGFGEVDEACKSYGLWEAVFLSRLPYPDPLPDVPEPKEDVAVKTGKQVPCFGVWEPTENGRCVGVMNYLLGDTRAPRYRRTSLNVNNPWGLASERIDVVWRLIWRDDRYEDGTIPEEEKGYIFLCPVPEGVEDPYRQSPLEYIRKHKLPHPFLDGSRQLPKKEQPEDESEREKDAPSFLQCRAGTACPRSGYWRTPARLKLRRKFAQGEIMPEVESANARNDRLALGQGTGVMISCCR